MKNQTSFQKRKYIMKTKIKSRKCNSIMHQPMCSIRRAAVCLVRSRLFVNISAGFSFPGIYPAVISPFDTTSLMK